MKIKIHKGQRHLWRSEMDMMGHYDLGITEAALTEIGEVTYLEPSEPWREYKEGDVFATVESRKGVWELRMPFDARCVGEKVATKEELNADWRNPLGTFSPRKTLDFSQWEESNS